VNFATELEARLKEFLASGLVDLHENGGRTSFVAGVSWEVRGDGERPLLHLWSERFNLAVELYEHNALLNVLEKIDPRSAGNVDTSLVPARESHSLLQRAQPALDSIVVTEPKTISLHPSIQTREVWLRFRGLPFARWEDARVYFGIGDCREKLTPASRPALKKLLQELELHRHPLAEDTHHALYRAQPERWLEGLVREDVTRVDPALDARYVYSQVFASSRGEHGKVVRVGLAESWRSGLRVVMRQ
jgi:hypothetical protein